MLKKFRKFRKKDSSRKFVKKIRRKKFVENIRRKTLSKKIRRKNLSKKYIGIPYTIGIHNVGIHRGGPLLYWDV